MLRNLIILPDGTKLFSGTGTVDAIKSVTLTELVNSGDELTLGSACANMLEATILTPQGGLMVTAGDEVTLYKVNDADQRHKVGIFVLEKPTAPTANTVKLLGYDRMIKLDKDLTAWLKGLTGWPYSLLDFASMVCTACGLTLATEDIPNADFPVYQFIREATGRQIMQWIGEVCCRFCRANADGEIELAWYTPAGVSITPSGDSYYFQNGLSYEEYQVETIGAVQLRLADSKDGMPWPSVDDGTNSYIITGNPILSAHVTADLLPVLQVIRKELPAERYTPCKVSIPATLDIHAGNTVQITDKNGVTFTTYVMTKTQAGQRDTLECTGSPKRDSAAAQNNKSSQQRDAELRLQVDSASNEAKKYTDEENKKLNQLELLKRLTNEWVDEGIYLDKNGKLAINASAILVGVLYGLLIKAGAIESEDGKIQIDLSAGAAGPIFNTGISTNGIAVRGDTVGASNVFSVEAKRYGNADTAEMKIYSTNGKLIGLLQETFTDSSYSEPSGVFLKLLSQGQTLKVEPYASDNSAGIRLWSDDKVAGYFWVDSSGASEFSGNTVNTESVIASGFSVFNSLSATSLGCSKINPGKKVLYSGSVSMGDTFDVPNTANYDLFAVKLGDSSGNSPSVVLAYKHGNTIYGVGGWCGTETAYKQLYFVSITFSGDTWTLVDAGVQDVYTSGGIGAGTRLQLKEVIGVI